MVVERSGSRVRALWAQTFIGAGLVALGLAGCGGESQRQGDMGSLEVPLLATANGNTYQLGGYVRVEQNPWGPPYYSNYFQLDGDVVSISLPVGQYNSDLQNWSLQRATNGSLRPVDAELSSSARQAFTIFAGSKSTITYRFTTDGFVIATGSGTVDVTVAVNERAPACTPFGDGCGDGTWCAPTELTGDALACIEHGPVQVGSVCSNPTSCVAGATCRAASTGGVGQAVCTALCPLSQLGSECASGGTCALSESGYGICVRQPSCGDAGSCAPPTCHGTCVEDTVNNGACNAIFAQVGPESDPIIDCVLGTAWPSNVRFPATSCANGNLLSCYCGSVGPSECQAALPANLGGACTSQILVATGCNTQTTLGQSQCVAQNFVNPANPAGRALAYIQCLQDNCPDICFAP